MAIVSLNSLDTLISFQIIVTQASASRPMKYQSQSLINFRSDSSLELWCALTARDASLYDAPRRIHGNCLSAV
ncbi:MAG: hypothetical protein AUG51_17405 [Acidobacteria bacterium 13_1_20CM_3_53_8]|nr:MAG: hypothetical protein AUG51_17405 [Acidobacteria bacterium 13_1_20CM_3_53_8]